MFSSARATEEEKKESTVISKIHIEANEKQEDYYFDNLPYELQESIFSYLDYKDLANAMRINAAIYRTINSIYQTSQRLSLCSLSGCPFDSPIFTPQTVGKSILKKEPKGNDPKEKNENRIKRFLTKETLELPRLYGELLKLYISRLHTVYEKDKESEKSNQKFGLFLVDFYCTLTDLKNAQTGALFKFPGTFENVLQITFCDIFKNKYCSLEKIPEITKWLSEVVQDMPLQEALNVRQASKFIFNMRKSKQLNRFFIFKSFICSDEKHFLQVNRYKELLKKYILIYKSLEDVVDGDEEEEENYINGEVSPEALSRYVKNFKNEEHLEEILKYVSTIFESECYSGNDNTDIHWEELVNELIKEKNGAPKNGLKQIEFLIKLITCFPKKLDFGRDGYPLQLAVKLYNHIKKLCKEEDPQEINEWAEKLFKKDLGKIKKWSKAIFKEETDSGNTTGDLLAKMTKYKEEMEEKKRKKRNIQ